MHRAKGVYFWAIKICVKEKYFMKPLFEWNPFGFGYRRDEFRTSFVLGTFPFVTHILVSADHEKRARSRAMLSKITATEHYSTVVI